MKKVLGLFRRRSPGPACEPGAPSSHSHSAPPANDEARRLPRQLTPCVRLEFADVSGPTSDDDVPPAEHERRAWQALHWYGRDDGLFHCVWEHLGMDPWAQADLYRGKGNSGGLRDQLEDDEEEETKVQGLAHGLWWRHRYRRGGVYTIESASCALEVNSDGRFRMSQSLVSCSNDGRLASILYAAGECVQVVRWPAPFRARMLVALLVLAPLPRDVRRFIVQLVEGDEKWLSRETALNLRAETFRERAESSDGVREFGLPKDPDQEKQKLPIMPISSTASQLLSESVSGPRGKFPVQLREDLFLKFDSDRRSKDDDGDGDGDNSGQVVGGGQFHGLKSQQLAQASALFGEVWVKVELTNQPPLVDDRVEGDSSSLVGVAFGTAHRHRNACEPGRSTWEDYSCALEMRRDYTFRLCYSVRYSSGNSRYSWDYVSGHWSQVEKRDEGKDPSMVAMLVAGSETYCGFASSERE